MARSARKRSPSGLYHVLLRAQREGLFASDADKRAFLAILEALAGQNAASLCAYCLMDDHVHLLLYAPQGPEKLARPLCARYAAYFNQSRGLKGKVFYDRFMSRPVEEGEDLLRHIRFIHMNPVRARMVFSPGDYAFSSYRSYTARRGPVDWSRAGTLLDGRRFEQYHFQGLEDQLLEPPQGRGIPDGQALNLLRAQLRMEPEDLKNLSRPRRDECLSELKSMGLSVRQIERLTGINRGIVQKA